MKIENVCLPQCYHYHYTSQATDHCEKTSPHLRVRLSNKVFVSCHHNCGFTIEQPAENEEGFREQHIKESDTPTRYCVNCNEPINEIVKVGRGEPPVCNKCLVIDMRSKTCPDCHAPLKSTPCACKHPFRR